MRSQTNHIFMAANHIFSKEIREEIIKDFYNQILFRQPTGRELNAWLKVSSSSSPGEIALDFFWSAERVSLCKKIESKKIAFLHIPKTAGSSFNAIFQRITRKIHTPLVNESPVSMRDASLITGHFGFSFLKNLDCTHSFTILRDPIARIISLYRYGRSAVSGWRSDNPVRHLDFEQWVSSEKPLVKRDIDNLYVRVMTDDLEEPFESREAKSLSLAIERYRQFTCVGDQARLDLFLKKMSAALGIPCRPNFPIANAADVSSLNDSSYEPRPQITLRTQRRLEELTRMDYEVYNTFRDREIIEAPSASAKPTSSEPPKPVLTIHNPTPCQWTPEGENPIQVACHWLDETWNMRQFDAQRFPLPAEGIPPQETREVEIQVTSPGKPGRYHLMVTLVQTIDGKEKWLNETGDFTPQIFDREVEE